MVVDENVFREPLGAFSVSAVYNASTCCRSPENIVSYHNFSAFTVLTITDARGR